MIITTITTIMTITIMYSLLDEKSIRRVVQGFFARFLVRVLARFWARFLTRFLARFLTRVFWSKNTARSSTGTEKYSVQCYRDREKNYPQGHASVIGGCGVGGGWGGDVECVSFSLLLSQSSLGLLLVFRSLSDSASLSLSLSLLSLSLSLSLCLSLSLSLSFSGCEFLACFQSVPSLLSVCLFLLFFRTQCETSYTS